MHADVVMTSVSIASRLSCSAPQLDCCNPPPPARRHKNAREDARGDALLAMPEGMLVIDVNVVHAMAVTYLQGTVAAGKSAEVDGAATASTTKRRSTAVTLIVARLTGSRAGATVLESGDNRHVLGTIISSRMGCPASLSCGHCGTCRSMRGSGGAVGRRCC